MNNDLLDTNVVSEIRKIGSGKANQRLAQWAKQIQVNHFYSRYNLKSDKATR